MPRPDKLMRLTDQSFLNELHHFLWIDPLCNGSEYDGGWSCRDHALVTAGLVRLLGSTPLLMNDELNFVLHSPSRSASLCLVVRPHTWVAIEGFGMIDLSIRPQTARGVPEDVAWTPGAICRTVSAGTVLVRSEQETPSVISSLLERKADRHALFVCRETEPLDYARLKTALDWIRSPLTDRLRERYDHSIISRLIRHLYFFLQGNARSMTSVSPEDAWESLAAGHGDPITWVASRAELR